MSSTVLFCWHSYKCLLSTDIKTDLLPFSRETEEKHLYYKYRLLIQQWSNKEADKHHPQFMACELSLTSLVATHGDLVCC